MRPTLRFHWPLLLSITLWAAGCGLAAPSVGSPVSPGVARADFEVRLDSTDLVRVAVLFPATDGGVPLPGPHPAVVFIQGGFVRPDRYAWQAEALARAGYVVALPEHFLDLAFFGIGVGEGARRLLVEPPPGSLLANLVDPRRIGVAGHSLGGVVALKLALAGGFQAVALEASFPDTADLAQLPGFTRPSLSLAGALDCSAPLANVKKGWQSLGPPTALVVLEGVTHYQFTNAQTEDLARNCAPVASLEDAHARIAQALVTFFGQALDGALDVDGLRAVPLSTVEAR